eukprot:2133346-Amphidinium_carterae.1
MAGVDSRASQQDLQQGLRARAHLAQLFDRHNDAPQTVDDISFRGAQTQLDLRFKSDTVSAHPRSLGVTT